MNNKKQILEKIDRDMKNIIELTNYVQNFLYKLDNNDRKFNFAKKQINKNLDWLKDLGEVFNTEFNKYKKNVENINKLTFQLNSIVQKERNIKTPTQKNIDNKLAINPDGRLEEYHH